MSRFAFIPAAVTALVLGSVALAGCGSDSIDAPVDAPTNPPVTSEPNVQPTPNPTQVANLPTPTAQPAKPANEPPKVLWMVMDHAGTGVVAVRLATDVETTAVVSVHGRVGEPRDPIEPVSDTKPATSHTLSTPTGMTDFVVQVIVTDAKGKSGIGELESGAIIGMQYWARFDTAPKITYNGKLAATGTWSNLRGDPGSPPTGRVIMLTKKAGCTTADLCQGEVVKTVTQDTTGGDATSTSHSIPFAFPDRTHDFQVLFAAEPVTGSNVTLFYQFDVLAKDVK